MYKFLMLILMTFLVSNSFSQDKLSFKEVDEKTYAMYLRQSWDSLIVLSEQAYKQEIDYYYLRMRTGIAYYETKRYQDAIAHFNKALVFNEFSDLAKEYLYYSYLFSGREDEANVLADSFSESLKEKINYKPKKFISSIDFGGGYDFNNSTTQKPRRLMTTHENNTVYKNGIYQNLSIKHKLSPRLNISQAYTYVRLSKLQRVNDYDGVLNQFPHSTNQNQYNLSFNYALNNGLGISLSGSRLWIDSYYTDIVYDTNQTSIIPVYSNINYTSKEYVGYLGVYKDFKKLYSEIGTYFSNLNNSKQFQLHTSLTWFPKGNLNFYISGSCDYWNQYESDIYTRNNFISSALLGFKLNRAWVEFNSTFGDINNFSSNKGNLIYNDLDKVKNVKSMNLIVPVKDRFEISFTTSVISKESISYYQKLNEELKLITNDYDKLSLSLNLKFKL